MKKTTEIDNNISFKKVDKRSKTISKSRITHITNGNALRRSTTQLHEIRHKENSILTQWKNLTADLLILVINKLNYEDLIHFRSVCKGWSIIRKSTCDSIHDIPLQAIAAILMKLATNSFQDFFNFLICWITGQNDRTVKDLLDIIPIQELYHWGDNRHMPKESMFTYFMTMSQRLGNKDAEFYWASKSIILRNHVYHDILEYSYKIIEDVSAKGHMLSELFKNMLDIYFFPKRREAAVSVIINMITSLETRNTITGMIVALKTIAGQIYPETIFGPLSGTPICTYSYPNQDNHYLPDGYPVNPEQIHDYTCLHCKVALLFGCLSAYLTQSLDFHLNLY